jgi:two-component system chemotaxis response regulator CheY
MDQEEGPAAAFQKSPYHPTLIPGTSVVILAGGPAPAGAAPFRHDESDRSASGPDEIRPGEMMAVDLSMPVLVVDDYNTMIRIIRNLLRQLGFDDIDDASDGSMALSKMQLKRYGLVISDWSMEPMTGYDLLKQMRSDPRLRDTPFIMVTAESKTENVIAAKQAGVNSYIVKLFNAELKTKIEAVFMPSRTIEFMGAAASRV